MSGDGGGAAQPGEAAAAHAPSSESHGDINLEPALAPSGGGKHKGGPPGGGGVQQSQ